MKKNLIINGMISNHCKQRVEKLLNEIQGILSTEVLLEKKTAVVEFEGELDIFTIEAVLQKGGYQLQEIRN